MTEHEAYEEFISETEYHCSRNQFVLVLFEEVKALKSQDPSREYEDLTGISVRNMIIWFKDAVDEEVCLKDLPRHVCLSYHRCAELWCIVCAIHQRSTK